MCHSSYPRLNDYGASFRDNGYRSPGSGITGKNDGSLPISAIVSVGYTADDTPRYMQDPMNGIRINNTQIFASSRLSDSAGFFVAHLSDSNIDVGAVASHENINMGNVVYTGIGSNSLTTRIGRFEPAYVAFSGIRRLSVMPYQIYDFNLPSRMSFSRTQTGVELSKRGPLDARYTLGWINGAKAGEPLPWFGEKVPDDPRSDFYLRAAKVFGKGEGQTSGQRVGVTGYFGYARPSAGLDYLSPGVSRKSYNRIGLDTSLNHGKWNLGMQYLACHERIAIADYESPYAFAYTYQDFDFRGGFAELIYQPNSATVGFVRYDQLNTPDLYPYQEPGRSRATYDIGIRRYLRDDVVLHTEYWYGTQLNKHGFISKIDFWIFFIIYLQT
jgi:hypothetical protein